MKSLVIAAALAVSGLWAASATAQGISPCTQQDQTECMLESIWVAASILPPEKQDRVKRNFLYVVAETHDAGLTREWSRRLNSAPLLPANGTGYARRKAQGLLAEGGWDKFLQRARAGTSPFNIGRPEIMAEGARLAETPDTRKRVINAMFDLAGPPLGGKGFDRSFEQADFGHVLAELSMEDCNLQDFDRAVRLTATPDSLRYALWRARITGDASPLAARIRNEADDQDTRHVRAVLEGYGPIISRGYCPD
ncbi:hypothetical protein [Hyphomonas pacifica]|uniref:Uncharacterized protein n=1 Tax=Hyphomonas pacifica TaxID=1280941 RepID=A0A062U292_9PROT|nr:hypothetical protein [Hyphomonas pacifica]KCZ52417.1 hypothetical protein HY2_08365 [Hyphomonas pacifica]RAN35190.1 hypothetical protein HY3_08965 [Hyphomonas pacifica]